MFVYEFDTHSLRLVINRFSWRWEDLWRDLCIPFGDGLTGAAFQQRRVATWSKRSSDTAAEGGGSLIKPIAEGETNAAGVEFVNMLALPIYHRDTEGTRRPASGSVIGVVTIGSSSYGSRIVGMDDEQLRSIRVGTQIQVFSVLNSTPIPTRCGCNRSRTGLLGLGE